MSHHLYVTYPSVLSSDLHLLQFVSLILPCSFEYCYSPLTHSLLFTDMISVTSPHLAQWHLYLVPSFVLTHRSLTLTKRVFSSPPKSPQGSSSFLLHIYHQFLLVTTSLLGLATTMFPLPPSLSLYISHHLNKAYDPSTHVFIHSTGKTARKIARKMVTKSENSKKNGKENDQKCRGI